MSFVDLEAIGLGSQASEGPAEGVQAVSSEEEGLQDTLIRLVVLTVVDNEQDLDGHRQGAIPLKEGRVGRSDGISERGG